MDTAESFGQQAKDVRNSGRTPRCGDPPSRRNRAAYVFLASPHCSSYITGEILPIIGGYTGG